MGIPRLQLFELEDQAWFPGVVRDQATDYLICELRITQDTLYPSPKFPRVTSLRLRLPARSRMLTSV